MASLWTCVCKDLALRFLTPPRLPHVPDGNAQDSCVVCSWSTQEHNCVARTCDSANAATLSFDESGFASIDLLYLRCLIRGSLHLLQWREVVIITQALLIIIARTELGHSVNASPNGVGQIKSLTILSSLSADAFFLQLHHDRVRWVDLRSLLGHHDRRH